jgi:hypothetical protein
MPSSRGHMLLSVTASRGSFGRALGQAGKCLRFFLLPVVASAITIFFFPFLVYVGIRWDRRKRSINNYIAYYSIIVSASMTADLPKE